jgi:hypothetical protein
MLFTELELCVVFCNYKGMRYTNLYVTSNICFEMLEKTKFVKNMWGACARVKINKIWKVCQLFNTMSTQVSFTSSEWRKKGTPMIKPITLRQDQKCNVISRE